jgi:hypothetical protein
VATKDITDLQVVRAYAEMKRQMDDVRPSGLRFEYADQILRRETGQPEKVCYRAMERAFSRDLVDYGTWLRVGWLTDKGRELLNLISQ